MRFRAVVKEQAADGDGNPTSYSWQTPVGCQDQSAQMKGSGDRCAAGRAGMAIYDVVYSAMMGSLPPRDSFTSESFSVSWFVCCLCSCLVRVACLCVPVCCVCAPPRPFSKL